MVAEQQQGGGDAWRSACAAIAWWGRLRPERARLLPQSAARVPLSVVAAVNQSLGAAFRSERTRVRGAVLFIRK